MSVLRFVFGQALTSALFVVTVVVVWPVQVIRAQQADVTIDELRKDAEFRALLDHLQKSNDPEERIAALEAALVKAWPENSRWRPQVEGLLQLTLGYSYEQRRNGDRAQNLEKAIREVAVRLRPLHG